MRRYRELLDYPANFITDRNYLIMKYASAIYEEVIGLGYIVRQSIESGIRGEYTIVNRETGEIVTDSPFQEFVTGEFARTEYLEFARLNSIVGGSSSYWNERVVTRQGLVEYILENNRIVSDAL